MVYIRGTVAERIGARIVPGDNGCTEWIGSGAAIGLLPLRSKPANRSAARQC